MCNGGAKLTVIITVNHAEIYFGIIRMLVASSLFLDFEVAIHPPRKLRVLEVLNYIDDGLQ
jgi:hypothetical protein